MSAQFARAPHRGSLSSNPGAAPTHHPHAALLIDFDNVTMGIRSDLSKELKNLLSSDIIKGKVAVQRAYADWRRYPQYIVPLAESSVDLIFAPAYGSSKKNATDIRLAIDALELVFTRPEIGSFILLSGDSDFSSLVLKLKEYGKYVIGVGIRESASDLLVQNCDEYYSYSALTGLTRAGDEPHNTLSQDPWELVEIAVRQMTDNNDVMRSDRLKQVILEMDPSFDEKALGFQKFNRFMQEAAGRGLVSLKKLENGQFEIGPALPGQRADVEEEEQRGNGRPRRNRRGGRGRGRDRERSEASTAPVAAAEEGDDADAIVAEMPDAQEASPLTIGTSTEDVASSSIEVTGPTDDGIVANIAESADEERESGRGRSRRGRGGRGRRDHVALVADAVEPAGAAPAAEAAAREPAESFAAAGTSLKDAYALLRRAAKDVIARGGPAARDSDVKRRMLELLPSFDESTLGFSKFSRFLRQAHDAETITLNKTDTGYDVMLGDHIAVSKERDRGPQRGRGRRHDGQPGLFEGGSRESSSRDTSSRDASPTRDTQSTAPDTAQTTTTRTSTTPTTDAPAAAASAPAQAVSLGFRRGSSRGRPLGGPPPLLAGQTVAAVGSPESVAASTPAPLAPTATTQVSVPPAGMDAEPVEQKKGGKKAAATKRSAPARDAGRGATKDTRRGAAPAKQAPVASSQFSALGFPTGAAAIATYLSEYKGVGPKSIQSVIDSFGATKVFDALQNQPDRVREVVGGARADRLLEAWADDYAMRKANATPPEKQKVALTEKRAPRKGPAAAKKRGGHRGGRKPTKRA